MSSLACTKDKDKYGLIQFQFRGWWVKVKAHWLSVYVQNHFQQTLINAITCLTKHVFNIRVYCSERCVNAATRVWMVPRLIVPDFLQNWSVYKMIQFYFFFIFAGCSFLGSCSGLAVIFVASTWQAVRYFSTLGRIVCVAVLQVFSLTSSRVPGFLYFGG